MKKNITAVALCLALAASPALAHHPAADMVDEEVYAMIDEVVSDTPHATMVFDDTMGSETTTLLKEILYIPGVALFFIAKVIRARSPSLIVFELIPKTMQLIVLLAGLEAEDVAVFKNSGDILRISIFLSLFDVHVNRAPIAGVSRFLGYFPGKHIFTFDEKSSDVNQHNSIILLLILLYLLYGFISAEIINNHNSINWNTNCLSCDL